MLCSLPPQLSPVGRAFGRRTAPQPWGKPWIDREGCPADALAAIAQILLGRGADPAEAVTEPRVQRRREPNMISDLPAEQATAVRTGSRPRRSARRRPAAVVSLSAHAQRPGAGPSRRGPSTQRFAGAEEVRR
jgi:hypothetical protein